MIDRAMVNPAARDEHQSWVRTRLQLEAALFESLRQGFSLIALGFGSFAIFDGLAPARDRAELPRVFALIATAIGVIFVALGARHFQKMKEWVDADEFGASAPTLPDEQRPLYLAAAACLIGVVSFIALLRLS